MNYSMDFNKLKTGISGIMRVRNEAAFLERSVASCINALDELIIVYNDCSDGSEKIIQELQTKYSEKIRAYEYPYKIYGIGLTEDEYEWAKSLPNDSKHLLCNYYNFALSKVTYRYAIKIDADQIYFGEVLAKLQEICKNAEIPCKLFPLAIGLLSQFYLTLFRRLSVATEQIFPLMPARLAKAMAGKYRYYAIYMFKKGKACLSLSGLNVFEDGKDVYVSLGRKNEIMNILPPFNGEGDHVLFEVTAATYFERFDMPYYNQLCNTNRSLIEKFVHPYRIMPIGFAWKHINSERPFRYKQVKEAKRRFPNSYMRLDDFLNAKWSTILKRSDKTMFNTYQRALFTYVYKAYGCELREFL